MPPALQLIPGGCSDDSSIRADSEEEDSPPDTQHPTPNTRVWRTLLVITLRYGRWLPPLWPMRWVLRMLRSWSIRRALQTLGMGGHLGFDGSDAFDYGGAFIRAEAEGRNNPAFWAACEHALRIGRVKILGILPIILDEEVNGKGQNAFLRHFGWTVARRLPHPLPPELTP